MDNKISIENFFNKWFRCYKKTISFSIINKPTKALQDSFNAGYTLGKKQHQKHIEKVEEEKKILERDKEKLLKERYEILNKG